MPVNLKLSFIAKFKYIFQVVNAIMFVSYTSFTQNPSNLTKNFEATITDGLCFLYGCVCSPQTFTWYFEVNLNKGCISDISDRKSRVHSCL